MRLEQVITLVFVPMAIAGAHGYFTNWVAVKLLLWPIRPVNVLGIRIQGLLPRRQAELADRIAEAVSREFLTEKDILGFLAQVNPAEAMRNLLVEKWEEKVGEILDGLPFVKAFVTPDRLHGIRDTLAEAFGRESDSFLRHLVRTLEDKIDLREAIRRNILAFNVERMNGIIEQIGRREFGEIAWIGLIIGLGVGAVQALVNVLAVR